MTNRVIFFLPLLIFTNHQIFWISITIKISNLTYLNALVKFSYFFVLDLFITPPADDKKIKSLAYYVDFVGFSI